MKQSLSQRGKSQDTVGFLGLQYLQTYQPQFLREIIFEHLYYLIVLFNHICKFNKHCTIFDSTPQGVTIPQ